MNIETTTLLTLLRLQHHHLLFVTDEIEMLSSRTRPGCEA